MALSPISKPEGHGQPSPKVQPRKPRRRPLGESTARHTIAMMRSMASHKPISPFHLMAADEMQMLLEEVLEYRRKNG